MKYRGSRHCGKVANAKTATPTSLLAITAGEGTDHRAC
jgi:hypothetical protein